MDSTSRKPSAVATQLRKQLRQSVPTHILERLSDEELVEGFYEHNRTREALASDREKRRQGQYEMVLA
jgi:hypothetical protein